MLLLVAYDGSDGAEASLAMASTLARAADAEVLLLRVLNPRTAAVDVVAPTTEQAMAVVEARERQALAAAADAGDTPAAQTLVALQERGEDVAETIERIATERAASIIVIGSRRAAGVAGLVLGSVTQHVLRNAPCPVLVVRP